MTEDGPTRQNHDDIDQIAASCQGMLNVAAIFTFVFIWRESFLLMISIALAWLIGTAACREHLTRAVACRLDGR